MTTYCQFCGTQLRQLARFCKNCGAKVIKEDDELEPLPEREFVPAQDDGDIPWRPDETAIILPIKREPIREDPWADAVDARAEIVPIDALNPSARREDSPHRAEIVEAEPASSPPAPQAPAPQAPAPQAEDAWSRRPDIQEYFASAASRRDTAARRESRSALPLLILLVAVLLLFFFAYFVLRGV